MLTNYFRTAWRSLVRGKSFSFINIAGLAIGMAGAMLILLWIQNEISFDKFHENKDNLYEVYVLTSNTDGHPGAVDATSQPLGPALKKSYPEIDAFTRVWELRDWLLSTNDKSLLSMQGFIVDSSFLKMFNFPLIEGNIAEQLKNRNGIVITQDLAKRLFGNEDAIGKIIKTENADNFTVTGVLKNPPINTRFQFDYLLPWSFRDTQNDGYTNETERWLSNNTSTYVLLKPNTNVAALNEKIKNITKNYTGRNDVWTHFLFPLDKWHLYSEFQDGKSVGGRIDTVRVFAVIAFFILLIACINFMNLSTARSEKRAKEVGIRKVVGARKSLLIGQFITEAFFTASIAGVIALFIVQLVLPAFDALVDTQLPIPYTNIYFWLCAFAFIIITSLLAGSYPAFYLSSFKPASIFKKQFKKTNSAISPRKVLVVLQFTFTIILIVATIVVRNQIQYAQDRDKGYSNNNLIHVDFVGDIDKNYPIIKQELINSRIASSVTKNLIGVTNGGAHTWGLRWINENPTDTNTTITLYSEDADWVKTAGLHLIAGRDIDIYKYPADSNAVVLNETAVKFMGFKDPVGQTIFRTYSNTPLRVVGVVKDYIIGSPYEKVPPTVIQGPGAWFTGMHIKLSPGLSTADALAKTEQIFKKNNPVYPFAYKFVDEEYATQFDSEQRTKTMAGLFASLAIFISCLGLFGLSAYVAETRTKEIGVRKVLGASVTGIAKLLSLDFLKLVVISFVIASPVAWYAMNKWLDNYTYKINISVGIFIVAGLLAIIIALLTVSFQAIKAALSNPVRSLRTE
ncbi:FtsX-like permease family protein [Panacibacter ginsenosidivorans]|uniref:FtsX-like permease family protein n=1 Tax=Panacibacter ginsenosidivorans TaxID=1813871 RepID=A0A5B8V372_9BACT|nr:ABC transporter permease [Panacibacter ginsenosidivorans]QEC65967.1 FtsX-like permease family protein [Panacibacter ginsenosidivorans]